MDDRINRQKAIEVCDWYEHEFVECDYAIRLIADDLKNLPSADVEPVVRCKDCKHRCGDYCHNDDGFAHFDHFFVHLDDYCSRGARMDGEE